ncbi:Bug family tripartite tricarboxylate transporter substrate binding protein [Pseudorhodoplanes sp.]|uniref:Bug family tripartite tricarboxylate transporter substrate binding protein n=1 Tax=Pseudorhodoplanes sp. TaxID=1934341 RepID=UPI00391C9A5C
MLKPTMALVAALLAFATSAHAQSWPAGQPIKVIIPFTAGSATDVIARTVFEQVGSQIGQSFVIDNRVGASGTIGANAVAKADPDGYTLLVNSSSHTITPSTFSNLPYDTEKDFAAVIPLANLANVLVVSPAKYKSVKDLVEAARAKPGVLNYGTAGSGSASHVNAERFLLAANAKAQHVPFKGAPEALREIVADRIDFYFTPLAPARGLINDGKLAAIAVSSSSRSKALPNVPTTIESGIPNSEYDFWIGLFAPAKTPAPILERLHKEIAAALANPGVQEKLTKLGADPMPMSAADFRALIGKEIKSNAELVKAAGIKPN